MIRNHRARPRGARVVPGVRPPVGIERRYSSAIERYVGVLRELVKTLLIPNLDSLYPKKDATSEHGVRLSTIMGQIRVLFEQRTRGQPKQMAFDFGKDIEANNKRRSQTLERAVIGVNVTNDPFVAPILDLFVKQNVDLITSIPETALSQIENMVTQSVMMGTRPEGLADDILERFDVSDSKAALIARDQTAKLNTAITRARHKSIGVEKYKWRGTLDNRERESHVKKEGRIFAWDDPPLDTGHPGEDFQCRCYPEAIIPTGGEEDADDE